MTSVQSAGDEESEEGDEHEDGDDEQSDGGSKRKVSTLGKRKAAPSRSKKPPKKGPEKKPRRECFVRMSNPCNPLTLMFSFRWTTGGGRVRARDGIRTPHERNARELVVYRAWITWPPLYITHVLAVLLATSSEFSQGKRFRTLIACIIDPAQITLCTSITYRTCVGIKVSIGWGRGCTCEGMLCAA